MSKKYTSRTWASSGSRPSAATAERWPASATVIFSSTLSAPLTSSSISKSWSSDRRGAAAVGMPPRYARPG